MNIASTPKVNRLPITFMIGIPALITLIVVLAWVVISAGWLKPHPAPNSYAVPSNPTIETKWGIRVSQIAVTASGGLIDMRYIALDPDKVHAMFATLDTTPKIEVPGKNVTISLEAPMHHKNTIDVGRTYFVLYVNRRNAIQRGDLVNIIIGDQKIENVPVR